MRAHVYTIGHSRHSFERFADLLAGPRVTKVVDVRRVPFSRRHPQFNRDRLAGDLLRYGIAYWHLEDLGGLRDPIAGGESRNTAWRKPFLRNYADHAQSNSFHDAMHALSLAAARQVCAIMCAEADWRQCHRQIISDYLILREFEVLHILPDGATEQARVTPFASVTADGTLCYSTAPPRQLPLDLA
ncbi:MAG: DUF488 domain-containing protein [Xanthobacteraceae bacterium]